MTPQQYAAGWREAGPDAGPPPCAGSGQLAMFAQGIVHCPVCDRRVAALLTGPLGNTTGPWVVRHEAPETDSPARRPIADGPSFGF